MNYLAHAYLSFDHPTILVGNMISDFVKGKAKYSYSAEIQKGIELHRMIDTFTDEHLVTKKAKEIFRPAYRLYSAPLIDIVFDHFLATDENIFSKESLQAFALFVYDTLEKYSTQLPPHFRNVLMYMKMDNWLFNYSNKFGIERSLRGLVRRATYLTESESAYHLFLENYSSLKEYFSAFFPDVKSFAKQSLDAIIY